MLCENSQVIQNSTWEPLNLTHGIFCSRIHDALPTSPGILVQYKRIMHIFGTLSFPPLIFPITFSLFNVTRTRTGCHKRSQYTFILDIVYHTTIVIREHIRGGTLTMDIAKNSRRAKNTSCQNTGTCLYQKLPTQDAVLIRINTRRENFTIRDNS